MSGTAAISDLHLGARGSYLTVPSVCQRLFDHLNVLGNGHLSLLVLVGDIMDLAAGRAPEPWVLARKFFQDLSEKLRVDEIVYVPGNHDHHVWVMLAEHEELLKKIEVLKSGYTGEGFNASGVSKVYLSATPMHKLFPGSIRGRVKFAYPFFVPPVLHGTRMVFHHGHYFDRTIMPLAGYAARRFLDVAKLEAFNLPYIEALFYLCSWDPQVQNAELHFYDSITSVGFIKPVDLLSRAWRRLRIMAGLRTVGACDVKRIDRIMTWAGFRDIGLRERDVWVFGHTHKIGTYFPAGAGEAMKLYDLGGWVLEHCSRRGQPGTWAKPGVFFADEQGDCRLAQIDLLDEEKASVRAKATAL